MTTTLAIPLFADHVAPRFCVADEVLVVHLTGSAVASSRTLFLAGDPWPERLSRLSALGVTVLLCGGFNRRFLPFAETLGIQVIWGLVGRADELVEGFCNGNLEAHQLHPGRRRGRRQEKEKCLETTRQDREERDRGPAEGRGAVRRGRKKR